MPSSGVTARPRPAERPSADGGEFDDLFDYDGGTNDPFSDNYKVPAREETRKEGAGKGATAAGLGLDEEVEVTRKARAPRIKLDENRLLSASGIPKLRKKAKDHLKFKGKGHEYSDASQLLAFYQIWLDDLFPKARFLDALAMVEKMGHRKRMQVARMEWINEGKPRSSVHEDSIFDEPTLPPRGDRDREGTATRIAPIFEPAASERPKTPAAEVDAEMNDLYDATPRPARQKAVEGDSQPDSLFGRGEASIFGPAKSVADDAPLEDDLDALLAEEEMMDHGRHGNLDTTSSGGNPAAAPREDNFDDEMEVMAEMDDIW